MKTENTDKKMMTFNFEVREINEEDRSFLAVGSTEAIDRHGEQVMQDGWDLDNFKQNPVLPWAHDYYNPPMAKATEIGFVEEDGKKKMVFRAKFPSIAELSSDPSKPSDWALFVDSLYNGYKNGYLRAWSVGFISKSMQGIKHTMNELLEISGVTIPSNPEALTLAYKEGKIDKSHIEASIRCMQLSIESLTKSITIKENGEEEIDMEQLKELQTAVAELKELLSPELVEQLKALGELDVTALKAVIAKSTTDDESNDSEESEDNKDANEDEESEGAASDEEQNVELSAEELDEAFKRGLEKAKAESEGKID